ncbi:MAG TPA: hypothetical protein VM096_14515 [Vicinamibacterales bacterium]|nr:hypothetical protein [Vicinamibacterales bacterium]
MTRHLIQLLLPTYTRDGAPIASEQFARVRVELTERFGGVTAYTRSPATGLWINEDEVIERDQVIMLEVVVENLDRGWWAEYRHQLEVRFAQEQIHTRAIAIELI